MGDQDVIDALVHDNPPVSDFCCPLIASATRWQDLHNTDLFVAAKAVARWPDQLRFAGTIAPLRAASHGQSLLYSWALYSWADSFELRTLAQAQKEYASHAQVIWKDSVWHERTITAAPLPCLRFAVMADNAGCTGEESMVSPRSLSVGVARWVFAMAMASVQPRRRYHQGETLSGQERHRRRPSADVQILRHQADQGRAVGWLGRQLLATHHPRRVRGRSLEVQEHHRDALHRR